MDMAGSMAMVCPERPLRHRPPMPNLLPLEHERREEGMRARPTNSVLAQTYHQAEAHLRCKSQVHMMDTVDKPNRAISSRHMAKATERRRRNLSMDKLSMGKLSTDSPNTDNRNQA